MKIEQRVKAFIELGHHLTNFQGPEKSALIQQAGFQNPWFTEEQVEAAFQGISFMLRNDKVNQWVNGYKLNEGASKDVGVVMAGNVPMVGFHDLIAVLVAGHRLLVKLSSKDTILMKYLIGTLIEIEPAFADRISVVERLNAADAVIATGSDNTGRYFEYYFRNIPHVIRKNRSSCAVLLGEESAEEFLELGKDVFAYFGLGCRNVSKLFVPEGFDFPRLLDSWKSFDQIVNHNKYANNYHYNRTIFLVGQTPFLDTGFLTITENTSLVSPLSVLYYERYKDQQSLKETLAASAEKIQCIVSANGWFENSIPFGKSQLPELTDYADGVDTLKFLGDI